MSIPLMNSNNIISNKYAFYDFNTKDVLNVKSANFANNEIISIIAETAEGDKEYIKGEFLYTNLILMVPGLGSAICGDLIALKKPRKAVQQYILQFGWHLNVSNQKLYTWYLLPIDSDYTKTTVLPTAKTLYYDDLCDIIGITNQMPGFLPEDIAVQATQRANILSFLNKSLKELADVAAADIKSLNREG